jgi:hypothetical protein
VTDGATERGIAMHAVMHVAAAFYRCLLVEVRLTLHCRRMRKHRARFTEGFAIPDLKRQRRSSTSCSERVGRSGCLDRVERGGKIPL